MPWEVMLLVPVALLIWWVSRNISIMRKEKKEAKKAVYEKNFENLTEYEKTVALEEIEFGRRTGHLNFIQADLLESKVKGTKSIAEMQMELEKSRRSSYASNTDASAFDFRVSDVVAPKKTDAEKQKEATKTIVKDAVVGGVIAGPAGAVVGAIVGKNKAENKKDS